MSKTEQPAGGPTMLQQVAQAAEHARQTVKSTLTGPEGLMARPYVIADMLRQKPGETGTRSRALEEMLSAYYAMTVGPRIAQYRAVHAMLVERDYISRAERFCIGTDEYIWAVPSRAVPSAPAGTQDECLVEIDQILGMLREEDTEPDTAMALVLETRSENFIIVFNDSYATSMHIRQYWRDVEDAGSALKCLKTRAKPLDAAEVVSMAGNAVDFSDDLPGSTYIRRPSLATFLNGPLWAGRDDSTAGLRYGDCRDPGYIVSIHETNLIGLPTVEDGMLVPYGLLAHVVSFLDYVVKLQQETAQFD